MIAATEISEEKISCIIEKFINTSDNNNLLHLKARSIFVISFCSFVEKLGSFASESHKRSAFIKVGLASIFNQTDVLEPLLYVDFYCA